MALTNKSTIPLGVHDLRVVEGAPRFNDGRLALRLDLDRRKWRQLIQRHEPVAVECDLGTLYRSGTKYTGGRPTEDWFLTIEQAIFYVSRSETKNAARVVAEVAKVVGALRRGERIPDTPWTDTLFARDAPTVERDGKQQNLFKLVPKDDEPDSIDCSDIDPLEDVPPRKPDIRQFLGADGNRWEARTYLGKTGEPYAIFVVIEGEPRADLRRNPSTWVAGPSHQFCLVIDPNVPLEIILKALPPRMPRASLLMIEHFFANPWPKAK